MTPVEHVPIRMIADTFEPSLLVRVSHEVLREDNEPEDGVSHKNNRQKLQPHGVMTSLLRVPAFHNVHHRKRRFVVRALRHPLVSSSKVTIINRHLDVHHQDQRPGRPRVVQTVTLCRGFQIFLV